MPNASITYEQVAHTAMILVERGETPTIQRIHEHLGSGSPHTLYKHLRAWKATQPPAEKVAIQLPEALVRAITGEIERQVSMARTDAEAHLQEAQQTSDTLAEAGEELEVQAEQLLNHATRLESERDYIKEERNAAQADIERLQKTLNEERRETEKIREALTQAQTRITLLTEQRNEARQAHMESQRTNQALEHALRTAERAQAVAEAKQIATEQHAAEQREALHAERLARQQDAEIMRKDIAQIRSDWKDRITIIEQRAQEAEKRVIAAERARTKAEIQLEAFKSHDGVRSPGSKQH